MREAKCDPRAELEQSLCTDRGVILPGVLETGLLRDLVMSTGIFIAIGRQQYTRHETRVRADACSNLPRMSTATVRVTNATISRMHRRRSPFLPTAMSRDIGAITRKNFLCPALSAPT